MSVRSISAIALLLLVAGCSSGSGTSSGPLPQCPAREAAKAGPGSIGSAYTFAALPSGSCASAPSCVLPVFGPCNNNSEYIGYPLNAYQCICTDMNWACSVMVQGGAVCTYDADAVAPDGH
jgi:hypothetical protein